VGVLIYIKLIEEKELEERFGSEYVEYKKRTPFLIPSFRRKVG
jgi:protein-S-isoprenylcysteine O-methyltransferase Ste14